MEHATQVGILKELMQQLDEGKRVGGLVANSRVTIHAWDHRFVNSSYHALQSLVYLNDRPG